MTPAGFGVRDGRETQRGGTYMTATYETMVARARDIAETVLKPAQAPGASPRRALGAKPERQAHATMD